METFLQSTLWKGFCGIGNVAIFEYPAEVVQKLLN
jgi:hypothetical protein